MRIRSLAVAVLSLAVLALAQEKQPSPVWKLKFADYKTTRFYKGKPIRPTIEKHQRMFQTRIRQGARHGPNFAGMYIIASWGCGSGCVSFAVVNARTGKVYDAPFSILGVPYLTDSGREYQGLDYTLGSRLPVADGCPEDEEKDCGTHYYEWKGTQFRQLRFEFQPQKHWPE